MAMEQREEPGNVPWCPSARPQSDGVVFAVRADTADRTGVRYLSEPVPVTAEVLDLASPADPREVFRFGAPCEMAACAHYTGSRCSLAERIVSELPVAAESLPPCRLRSRCRWFMEQGAAACVRCPLIITLQRHPDPSIVNAALPPDADSDKRLPH
jgi:hypothetical protein